MKVTTFSSQFEGILPRYCRTCGSENALSVMPSTKRFDPNTGMPMRIWMVICPNKQPDKKVGLFGYFSKGDNHTYQIWVEQVRDDWMMPVGVYAQPHPIPDWVIQKEVMR